MGLSEYQKAIAKKHPSDQNRDAIFSLLFDSMETIDNLRLDYQSMLAYSDVKMSKKETEEKLQHLLKNITRLSNVFCIDIALVI